MPEPVEVVKCSGIPRGQCPVVGVYGPCQQGVSPGPGVEIPSALGVGEFIVQYPLQFQGLLEVPGLEGCLVEFEKGPDSEGVVVQESLLSRSPVYPAVVQVSVGSITWLAVDDMRRLSFGFRRPARAEQLEDLRLISRYPQGLTASLKANLLASLGQSDVRALQ